MSKRWRRPAISLGVQMVLSLLLSGLVAMGAFFLLANTGWALFSAILEHTDLDRWQTQHLAGEFREYVEENHIRSDETEKIDQWVRKWGTHTTTVIYVHGHTVYNSDYPWFNADNYHSTGGEDGAGFTAQMSQFMQKDSGRALYYIPFADADGILVLHSFYDKFYYTVVDVLSMMMAFLTFIITFVLLVHRKTAYINRLAKELRMLEGGQMDYPITLRGSDELTELARGIDAMRRSVLDRWQTEEEARRVNSELITSMSHDLRTPLTALLGYLELAEGKRYDTPEKLEEYIHRSREKAVQIKNLSDRLFEYFLVYGRQEPIETGDYPGGELLSQLLGESVFDLQAQDFTVEFTQVEEPFTITTNAEYLRRVVNNLFSNLTKYADPAYPVYITEEKRDAQLAVTFRNRCRTLTHGVESTHLGLATCQRILTELGGSMTIDQQEDTFTAELLLPVVWGKTE